ncbi:MAG TPA: hydroxyethylthiazole kinase [Spirochaetota bacterium]|nr:hydroxyethylthiazole kinase [Spirochaetota bacterium]
MKINSLLNEIRTKQPLIHHITNWVTIFNCAQAVKSLGASPVMAHAPEEAAEITSISSALVLNIGTLTEDIIESMLVSAKAAAEKKIPVVLDICGAGASSMRNSACIKLISSGNISIIKGNASEVSCVAGLNVTTKGVDSTEVSFDLPEVARDLSDRLSCIVVITGKKDYIAGGGKFYTVDNGSELMGKVVGTGCMAASMIGCFAAVLPGDLPAACAAALSAWGIAGEKASEKSSGAGTFLVYIFDELSSLTEEDILRGKKITEIKNSQA